MPPPRSFRHPTNIQTLPRRKKPPIYSWDLEKCELDTKNGRLSANSQVFPHFYCPATGHNPDENEMNTFQHLHLWAEFIISKPDSRSEAFPKELKSGHPVSKPFVPSL